MSEKMKNEFEKDHKPEFYGGMTKEEAYGTERNLKLKELDIRWDRMVRKINENGPGIWGDEYVETDGKIVKQPQSHFETWASRKRSEVEELSKIIQEFEALIKLG